MQGIKIDPSNLDENKKVCYLLLKIGIPSRRIPINSRRDLYTLASARSAGKILGIKISSIQVRWGKRQSVSMYYFYFPKYECLNEKAMLIGDSFLLAMRLFCGPYLDEYNPSVFRIPHVQLERKDFIDGEVLINFEEKRESNDRVTSYPITTFGISPVFYERYYEHAWDITPVLYKDDKLRNAVRFFCISQENYYVNSENLDNILDHYEDYPKTFAEFSRFETALLNSFKAVEAIIGEPPKDDRKLFSRLLSIGLDPNEMVGYKQKKKLFELIREMNEARDKKTAHGSTPVNNKIKLGELLEFQKLSQYFVYSAIRISKNFES